MQHQLPFASYIFIPVLKENTFYSSRVSITSGFFMCSLLLCFARDLELNKVFDMKERERRGRERKKESVCVWVWCFNAKTCIFCLFRVVFLLVTSLYIVWMCVRAHIHAHTHWVSALDDNSALWKAHTFFQSSTNVLNKDHSQLLRLERHLLSLSQYFCFLHAINFVRVLSILWKFLKLLSISALPGCRPVASSALFACYLYHLITVISGL